MNIQEEKEQLHIVDDSLIDIAKKTYLQKILTPTNLLEECAIFIQKNGQYNPQFTYNFPKEEELLAIIQALHDMNNKFFEGKTYTLTIHHLFKEQIDENIYKAQLLVAYIHQDFPTIEKYNTLLFWTFSDEIIAKSEHIQQTYKEPDPTIRWKKLTNEEIISSIEDYLKQENISAIQLKLIPFSMNKFLITFGEKHCHLIFSKNLQTREQNLHSNLIHEIQVHYKRYVNGKKSEWKILAYGTSHYFADEEGLALYDMYEYKRKQYPDFEKKSIYDKYILLYYSQWKSFVDIANHIQTLWITSNLKKIFTIAATMKRWIQDTWKQTVGNIFIKNKIYAEGLDNVTKWIAEWNNKELLYQWKIKIEDLPYV